LSESVCFQPVAFEMLGPMIRAEVDFISELSRILEQVSGDTQEQYFFQYLLMTVQWYSYVVFERVFFNQPDADTR